MAKRVEQGDPMSSILFNIVLNELIRKLNADTMYGE